MLVTDEFHVDLPELDKLAQLFDRQRQHLIAIAEYVEQHCDIGSSIGLLLSFLKGSYENARQVVSTGFADGAKIADFCRIQTEESARSYQEADRTSLEQIRAIAERVDVAIGGYEPPPGGTLVVQQPPGSTAVWGVRSDYSPGFFSQATDVVDEGATIVGEASATWDAIAPILGVTEVDAFSYLSVRGAATNIANRKLNAAQAVVEQPSHKAIGDLIGAPAAALSAASNTIGVFSDVQAVQAATERRSRVRELGSHDVDTSLSNWAGGSQ